jgi:hypothetical protein
MSTETEIKFCLRLDDEVEKVAQMSAFRCHKLEQGYLRRKSRFNIRVRRQTDAATGIVQHSLQAKLRVKESVDYAEYLDSGIIDRIAPPRTIEVGTNVSERDFLDFWISSKGRLTKFRYIIQSETTDDFKDENGRPWQEAWEVDFFKTLQGDTYFVQAECELPEGVMEPLFRAPDIIRDNTVFRVPRGDSRFSNSRLGDVGYAARLYTSLFPKKKGKEHESDCN